MVDIVRCIRNGTQSSALPTTWRGTSAFVLGKSNRRFNAVFPFRRDVNNVSLLISGGLKGRPTETAFSDSQAFNTKNDESSMWFTVTQNFSILKCPQEARNDWTLSFGMFLCFVA